MKLNADQIQDYNRLTEARHREAFHHAAAELDQRGVDVEGLLERLTRFQVAIPSWALGVGGTRFGRFSIGGEPRDLAEKIEDVGLLHALTRSAGAISPHLPWDIPKDPTATLRLAAELDLVFDAVNSNTFQDQPAQRWSYKFGSLCHVDAQVRRQAVAHNREVIDQGRALGSNSITVWLADGASFPGQLNFRRALERTLDSLREIYAHLPHYWRMYIEYKPYEPYFYSTVIQDWGVSYLLASELGDKAACLVDLGHHLPNTNIEQIVATLLWRGKLGGFHFNDSKYGDDDLTVGSIKPYQLFLIFNELVESLEGENPPDLAWMIDASHNLKDPLEDLMQSLEAIRMAYAQALLVDRSALEAARAANDVVLAQELLQGAFRHDVRPLLAEARRRAGAALDPIGLFRHLAVRERLIEIRGREATATGL
jgi:L-rhamnose isomerase/sugar isomerase